MSERTYVLFEGVPGYAKDVDITEFLERWGDIDKFETYRTGKTSKTISGLVKFRELESTRKCLKDSGKYTLYQQRIRLTARSV